MIEQAQENISYCEGFCGLLCHDLLHGLCQKCRCDPRIADYDGLHDVLGAEADISHARGYRAGESHP